MRLHKSRWPRFTVSGADRSGQPQPSMTPISGHKSDWRPCLMDLPVPVCAYGKIWPIRSTTLDYSFTSLKLTTNPPKPSSMSVTKRDPMTHTSTNRHGRMQEQSVRRRCPMYQHTWRLQVLMRPRLRTKPLVAGQPVWQHSKWPANERAISHWSWQSILSGRLLGHKRVPTDTVNWQAASLRLGSPVYQHTGRLLLPVSTQLHR